MFWRLGGSVAAVLAVACSGLSASDGVTCGPGTDDDGRECTLSVAGADGEPLGGADGRSPGGKAGSASGAAAASSAGESASGGEESASSIGGQPSAGGTPSGEQSTGGEGGKRVDTETGGAPSAAEGDGGRDSDGSAGHAGQLDVGGAGAPPQCPDLPEVCGNQLDDNCDGYTDEGCDCTAVAAGDGGEIVLTGSPLRLVVDPARCLLYAIDSATPTRVLVVDTGSKQELPAIELDVPANGLDISSEGDHLVIWHPSSQQLSIVDAGTRKLTKTLDGAAAFVALDGGRVAFATPGSFATSYDGQLTLVDISSGTATSVAFDSYDDSLQIATTPDKKMVYTFASELQKWNVAGPSIVLADAPLSQGSSVQLLNTGLFAAKRHVYAPSHLPGGTVQLPSDDLSILNGSVSGTPLAEDSAGTFLVMPDRIVDAETFRFVGELGHEATTAVLTNDDKELWTYDPNANLLRYANVADFFDAADLGLREHPADALSEYSLTQLAADPKRARLYGLDRERNAVIAIDRDSLVPIAELLVGSMPSDFSIDPTGTTLFVGLEATTGFTRVDLDALEVDGLVPWKRVTYEIEALSGQRVATVDKDQHTFPVILDANTGKKLGPRRYSGNRELRYLATLSASADGDRLFIGESNVYFTARMEIDDVTSGDLVPTATLDFPDDSQTYPRRWSALLPDASGVFYADYLFEADLSSQRYEVGSRVYAVTPDGRVATTINSVLRVSDGKILGALPLSSSVQAVSSESNTLYMWDGSQIVVVDLESYQ